MNSIPNKRHSDLLKNLCEELELFEPYRYPNFSEYTYIPSDPLKKNRSRIDFFLASKTLAKQITDCSISNCLQNKLFDHKSVNLSFKKNPKPITIPSVSKGILRDPETDLVVGLAVVDTYIIYSTSIAEEEKLQLRIDCGQAWRLLREAGPGDNYAAPGDRTELEELSREAKLGSVREFLEFFPFARARDGTLSIGDDIFMECLMNNIKNETISYQIFVKKN
jgi:hypothetical protein